MGLMDSLVEPKQPAARKGNNSFGVVLQVSTAQKVMITEGEKQTESLQLTGKILNSQSALPAGSEVAVEFRVAGASAVSNYVKGNGKKCLNTPDASAGTFVTLESCYVTENADENGLPILSSRWVNTLASAGDADHANRSFVEDVYATAPRITFKNPEKLKGEPDSITIPVNAKNIRARVEDEGNTGVREFTREWAVAKLNAVPSDARIGVTLDHVAPADAKKIESESEFYDAMAEVLAAGTKAMALVRITDGVDVKSRQVYVSFKKDDEGNYVPDIDRAIKELTEKNIIGGIPNEKLFGAIEQGLVIEVIPGYRMTYAGDPNKDNNAAFKLVSDVRKGQASRYEVMFGNDANAFTKVIVPGIARNDTTDGFSPINVITAEPGNLAATDIPSPYISRKAVLERPEAEEPADAPNDSAESAHEEEEPSGPRP
ncbi:hypothetical protein ACW0US_17835 [Xanthomonas euvesicatoria]